MKQTLCRSDLLPLPLSNRMLSSQNDLRTVRKDVNGATGPCGSSSLAGSVPLAALRRSAPPTRP